MPWMLIRGRPAVSATRWRSGLRTRKSWSGDCQRRQRRKRRSARFDMKYNATILVRELQAMRLLASEDETRFVLNGVHVELGPEHVLLIATDGRRLGVLRCGASVNDAAPIRFTIPVEAIDRIARRD